MVDEGDRDPADSSESSVEEAEPQIVSWTASLGRVLGLFLVPLFVLVAFGLLMIVPAGLVWGIIESFPEEIQESADPGWFERIFGTTSVLWGGRIVVLALAVVLLIGGAYVAISAVVRMQRREWLHKAGPFEARVAEVEESLEEDVEPLLSELLDAMNTNQDLEQRLEERNKALGDAFQELEQLYGAWQGAQEEVANLQAEVARLREEQRG